MGGFRLRIASWRPSDDQLHASPSDRSRRRLSGVSGASICCSDRVQTRPRFRSVLRRHSNARRSCGWRTFSGQVREGRHCSWRSPLSAPICCRTSRIPHRRERGSAPGSNDILFNTLESSKYPGQWNVDVMTNQSLAGSLYAWIISTWTWETGGLRLHYRMPPLTSPRIAKLIVYGIGSSLMLTSFLRMRFAGWKAKASPTPNVFDALHDPLPDAAAVADVAQDSLRAAARAGLRPWANVDGTAIANADGRAWIGRCFFRSFRCGRSACRSPGLRRGTALRCSRRWDFSSDAGSRVRRDESLKFRPNQ